MAADTQVAHWCGGNGFEHEDRVEPSLSVPGCGRAREPSCSRQRAVLVSDATGTSVLIRGPGLGGGSLGEPPSRCWPMPSFTGICGRNSFPMRGRQAKDDYQRAAGTARKSAFRSGITPHVERTRRLPASRPGGPNRQDKDSLVSPRMSRSICVKRKRPRKYSGTSVWPDTLFRRDSSMRISPISATLDAQRSWS